MFPIFTNDVDGLFRTPERIAIFAAKITEFDDMSELRLMQPHRSPATSIALYLLVILGGFFIVGPMIGFLLAIPFMEGGLDQFTQQIQRVRILALK